MWRSRRAFFELLLGGMATPALAQKIVDPKTEKVQTITLELSLSGLSPASLALEPGVYNFRLVNQGILGAFSLQLEDDKGRKLAESTSAKRSEKKSVLVRLGIGEHVMQIEGQPRWRCLVSVKETKK